MTASPQRSTAMTAPRLPVLSLLETRVLGVLSEKQHTVPDTYPLSLKALVAGCNQKTSRHPIIEATEAEVQATIDSLKGPALIVESSGGRVTRTAHNLGRALRLPAQSIALLTALMRRGPQTAGELRNIGVRHSGQEQIIKKTIRGLICTGYSTSAKTG